MERNKCVTIVKRVPEFSDKDRETTNDDAGAAVDWFLSWSLPPGPINIT